MRFYSIIIPVYNRPDEIDELLASLVKQTNQNFEVIILEDGSTIPCKERLEHYIDKLDINYLEKENTGQGFSRNEGFKVAKGDYFLVFDSDCILPENYLEVVDANLSEEYLDAFGGPDRAEETFTSVQKAINYSMTSVFTTGGIRGKKKHAGTYHPRSFNMGISRQVFEKTGGYRITRMGEDIEFSIRIIANGFKVGLIDKAYVYHKRRTSLYQFYKQLHFFGRARINVSRFHKDEVRLVHLFPLFFFIGLITLLGLFTVNRPLFNLGASILTIYYLIILMDSTVKNKSLLVGVLSVLAANIQLLAYALGMISEIFSGPSRQIIRT